MGSASEVLTGGKRRRRYNSRAGKSTGPLRASLLLRSLDCLDLVAERLLHRRQARQ